ncbi:MAG: Hsp20/alpha crystallin family protein [Spirochaetia bacterium]|nr:Hsp20/alpha crystallin family protein [Spirochaetia bacterium]
MMNYLMNRDFDTLLDTAWDNFTGFQDKFPPMNIKENNDGYEVELEMPGVNIKDVSIKLDKHLLTVSSDQSKEKEDKSKKYLVKESTRRSFSRSVSLGEDVNEDGITAKLDDGVLKIVLPKKPEAKAKAPKLIEVTKAGN